MSIAKAELFRLLLKSIDQARDSAASLVRKTSNPVYSEGKTLHGNMPTMPRTDSMFDRYEKERPANKPSPDDAVHGQKHTGRQHPQKPGITQPGSTYRDGVENLHIYFDQPGDYQG